MLRGQLQSIASSVGFQRVGKQRIDHLLFRLVRCTDGYGDPDAEEGVLEAVHGRGTLRRVVLQHISDQLNGFVTRILDQHVHILREMVREFVA